ncbi:hypothetical protein GCM10022226_62130 [Sphaerisporangium flaviroseum]|uniref:Uncharacterized protein n=1 Tax=Sphaerisporangium flaviroseum TaxID=509199 RepID=A0ABP7J2B5_9ACTN
MPKTTSDRPHGYDAETDTVRVRRHDLARLLLTFRDHAAELREGLTKTLIGPRLGWEKDEG